MRQLFLSFSILALVGCSGAGGANDQLNNATSAFTPTALDYQGAPMQLGPAYVGTCAYHYKAGANASTCTANLQTSQDMTQVSLVMKVAMDGQEYNVTTGNFHIIGNKIQDDRGLSVGSIGATAMRITSTDFGALSIKFLTDGTVGLLVNDIPTLEGDHSKGPAFAAKLKLPNQ